MDLKEVPLCELKSFIEEALKVKLVPFHKVNPLLIALKKVSDLTDNSEVIITALSALDKFHGEE